MRKSENLTRCIICGWSNISLFLKDNKLYCKRCYHEIFGHRPGSREQLNPAYATISPEKLTKIHRDNCDAWGKDFYDKYFKDYKLKIKRKMLYHMPLGDYVYHNVVVHQYYRSDIMSIYSNVYYTYKDKDGKVVKKSIRFNKKRKGVKKFK